MACAGTCLLVNCALSVTQDIRAGTSQYYITVWQSLDYVTYNSGHRNTDVCSFLYSLPLSSFLLLNKETLDSLLEKQLFIYYTPFNKLSCFFFTHHQKVILFQFLSSYTPIIHYTWVAPSP